jgi:hypothetical protein
MDVNSHFNTSLEAATAVCVPSWDDVPKWLVNPALIGFGVCLGVLRCSAEICKIRLRRASRNDVTPGSR